MVLQQREKHARFRFSVHGVSPAGVLSIRLTGLIDTNSARRFLHRWLKEEDNRSSRRALWCVRARVDECEWSSFETHLTVKSWLHR